MEKLRAIRRVIAVAILGALPVAPAAAQNFPMEWHWVRVTPTQRAMNWEVGQSAKAEVTFTRDGFVAKLYDDANPSAGDQPDILLTGHIRGKSVTAVEMQPGTDAGHWTLHGTILRARTALKDPSNGWGEDRISLVEGSEFIGLARQVRSGAPPGK